MLLLKPALFFVTWNDRTIMACTWASFHIFKWKDDTKMETEGPLGSSGVCDSDVKNKRSDVPSLSDCPRPTLHTPRGHRSPYQAPGSSDLTFPLCPGKRTLKTGHLSSLCCTVGLALCVERDWQHSAPFLASVWPAIHPELVGSVLRLSETMIVIPPAGRIHVSGQSFIIARKARLVLCASAIIQATENKPNESTKLKE